MCVCKTNVSYTLLKLITKNLEIMWIDIWINLEFPSFWAALASPKHRQIMWVVAGRASSVKGLSTQDRHTDRHLGMSWCIWYTSDSDGTISRVSLIEPGHCMKSSTTSGNVGSDVCFRPQYQCIRHHDHLLWSRVGEHEPWWGWSCTNSRSVTGTRHWRCWVL